MIHPTLIRIGQIKDLSLRRQKKKKKNRFSRVVLGVEEDRSYLKSGGNYRNSTVVNSRNHGINWPVRARLTNVNRDW